MRISLLTLAFTLLTSIMFAQSPGNCLQFNGLNNNVSTTLPPVFNSTATNDITVEAWVYPEGNNFSRILFAQSSTSNFVSLSISTGNTVYFYVSNVASQTANTGLPANQWTHVACTWTAATQQIQIYFNGVLQTSTNGGSSSTGNNNIMTIGSRTNNAQYFTGRVDEMRIWDVVRTPCQIQSAMTTEFTVVQPNLVASYNFNQGVAGGANAGVTTLPELNNAFNGTLNGFTLSGAGSNWIASGATITSTNQTNSAVNGVDTQVSCAPITWIDGNTYSSSNNSATFLIPGGSTGGCDSLVTLDLTILTPSVGTDVQSACQSYTWLDGNTYTSDNNSATYTYVGGSSNGCDSTVTLDLTIFNSVVGTDVQSACESYTWVDGNTYTSDNNSATYTYVGGSSNGCDSTVTLDLTIFNSVVGTDVQSACGSYTWVDGNTYTSDNNSATYTYVGGSSNGCDSTVTLDLTVNTVDLGTSVASNVITASAVGAAYQWLDCDNSFAVIAGETGATFTPTSNGNYAVQVTENNCTDTSACVAITTIGIIENSFGDVLSVYPNPTNGLVSIEFSEVQGTISASLYSLDGKMVQQKTEINVLLMDMMIHEPSGVYILELSNEIGTKARLRIIKK